MLLEYLRRPVRIEDWNTMVDAINNLEKEIQELKEDKEVLKRETLTYTRVFNDPSDFFTEQSMYTFPYTVNEEIDGFQTYGYLKNIYKFDRQMQKDIEGILSSKKGVLLTVNVFEEEKPEVVVTTAEEVPTEDKPKKRGRKKKGGRFSMKK